MSLQKLTQKFGGVLTKNSTTLLTGAAVAGLFATTILAVKATPKALLIINEEEYRNKEKVTAKEAVKLTWKCYLPAAVMGAATIGCIIGANSINLRRNAALASLYALSETAIKEYKEKVVKHIGSEKEKVIRNEIVKEKIEKNPISENEIILTNKGDTLCYDAVSGRYFKSDIETIRQALNKLSRDMMSESFVTLNQVYSELNLKGTKIGENTGWHIDDGLIEPFFSSHLTDNGTPCLVLDYETEPRYNYSNY